MDWVLIYVRKHKNCKTEQLGLQANYEVSSSLLFEILKMLGPAIDNKKKAESYNDV